MAPVDSRLKNVERCKECEECDSQPQRQARGYRRDYAVIHIHTSITASLLAQRANDHEEENTNGSLSKPQFRGSSHGSDQRQEDQDDSQRRHVPHEGAQQKNPCCVQGEIGDATPKIEMNTPLGHPTVTARNMRYQNACCKQGKRLDE